MYMPQEIEVWYLLPAIRREFALSMLKKGLKQKDIAKYMDIRESTVSQYLSSTRAKSIKFNKGIKKSVEIAVNKIINNQSSLILEIQKICELSKKQKFLCCIHKKHDKNLKQCEVCLI